MLWHKILPNKLAEINDSCCLRSEDAKMQEILQAAEMPVCVEASTDATVDVTASFGNGSAAISDVVLVS